MSSTILTVISNYKDEIPSANLSKILDSSKVTDHHAIIPTISSIKEDLSNIPETENNIYNLIMMKLLCAVHLDHVFDKTSVTVTCMNHEFKVSGKVVIEEGFKKIVDLLPKKNLGAELYKSAIEKMSNTQLMFSASLKNIVSKIKANANEVIESVKLTGKKGLAKLINLSKVKEIVKNEKDMFETRIAEDKKRIEKLTKVGSNVKESRVYLKNAFRVLVGKELKTFDPTKDGKFMPTEFLIGNLKKITARNEESSKKLGKILAKLESLSAVNEVEKEKVTDIENEKYDVFKGMDVQEVQEKFRRVKEKSEKNMSKLPTEKQLNAAKALNIEGYEKMDKVQLSHALEKAGLEKSIFKKRTSAQNDQKSDKRPSLLNKLKENKEKLDSEVKKMSKSKDLAAEI